MDRQATFSGTAPVPPSLVIDAATLAPWLDTHVEGFRGPFEIRQFKGGQSNPTYMISARSGRYVLRRKPPGDLLPSAHAVEREYRVMKALGDEDFPVPRVLGLEEGGDVAGTPFYIMAFAEGRVFWNPDAPELDRDHRAALFDSLNATIAKLHGFDPETVGLGDYGRADGYVGRQIDRWSKQYRASETASVPAMDELMEWLPHRVPAQPRTAIVHGDYRLDNCIVHPTEPRIVAVLDWELSTLGDPVADLTYHLMQWEMPPSESGVGVGSLLGMDLAALGIPSIEDYAARYGERTGISTLDHLDFYFAYNFFRLAAIFQGIVGRVRDGTATNANAPALASQVAPLAEKALWHARKADGTGRQ